MKAELKNAASVDTWKFAKNVDLAHLKSSVDKWYIDRLKNVQTNLSNWKSKVDQLAVDKLVPIPVDLSKLSDVVKNDVVTKDIYIMLRPKKLKIKYLIPLIWLLMLLLMLKQMRLMVKYLILLT